MTELDKSWIDKDRRSAEKLLFAIRIFAYQRKKYLKWILYI